MSADPFALFDGVDTVLFVHAHPDDETLAGGALMVELLARGIHVQLVTCSRGERGEVVTGPFSHLEGTPELAAHREGEIAGALEILGVTDHAWLGTPPARAAGQRPRVYEDSGMRWIREGLAGPAGDASAQSFSTSPLKEEVADLLALIDDPVGARPQLVVSYNEIGGYGHPDHVRAREIAVAAAAARGIRFAELVEEPGEDVTWFALEHRLDTVIEALHAHATQLTVHGRDVVHSGGQREPIRTSIGLREI
ncbi:N-acetyl-1-D-myo-inositol-2-amino-2-deoxy-alpha-D-glucopyranoside deacetylase [Paramicrobacterium humi]|uniref:N-acetyl-1-D-myo-inositol-2-amino-2-deoxy-alpha-D-glucopyranoside deacetylase n=1 Tax=Paramicrobacterium humi TaxID=640635 RepID=A0A1H4KRG8_9MICO|nr:PIG-L family deacetylase [Microbacterium humi]SEB60826.1 N-acetyl-1-D-myo-inositol-2-amino-2-deoxy-alpha-D-glucopyranoside deacetylase [Microbacterium humi]